MAQGGGLNTEVHFDHPAKGAFRFITGASDKAAYEIKTSTATMGVRGTVFDVFVADIGESIVLLHEGSVEVCAGLLKANGTISSAR